MEQHELKDFLKTIPQFENIEEEAIDWLIARSEIRTYPKDTFIFKPGDPLDHMLIFLSGQLDIYVDTEQGRQDIGIVEAKTITGLLPFSRSKGAGANGRVMEEVKTLELHRSCFVEMVNTSYTMTQQLVATMSDRIRDVTQIQFQDEKLKALGKISAGLAHELNNPISAIARSSENLQQKISTAADSFQSALAAEFSPEQATYANDLIQTKMKQYETSPKDFTVLGRQDRMDDLLDWLEDNDVEEPEELSETFTEFDFTEDDLDNLQDELSDAPRVEAALKWANYRLSVELLVKEIKEASHRVSDLVQSIKEYSHMDHGSGPEEIDLHNGLRTTLNILGHRFREKQIEVHKDFGEGIPTIQGNAGQLNQVWTNLLSNAIDAVEQGGQITVYTFLDRDYICICIEDNGKGIPEDILGRIWEPFFTTKKVGEGTGIGLDVVQKIIHLHRGSIKVESQPGKTRFITQFLRK